MLVIKISQNIKQNREKNTLKALFYKHLGTIIY